MTAVSSESTAVRLRRTIPAAPERVYRAWLDPDVLRRWMSGAGKDVTRAEVDERAGGRYAIWQAGPDADTGGFECEIVDLVPDARIVLLWRFVGPAREYDPAHDSQLTVTFAEAADGGTELTLLHERLEAFAAAMPDVARYVPAGWEQALDKLVHAV